MVVVIYNIKKSPV